MLDLSKPAVQDFIVESVFRVVDSISIGTNVPYLKWDFNRGLTDIFSTSVSPERQGSMPCIDSRFYLCIIIMVHFTIGIVVCASMLYVVTIYFFGVYW